MRPSLPEFADAVTEALSEAPPPAEAPQDVVATAVVRGLRRAGGSDSP